MQPEEKDNSKDNGAQPKKKKINKRSALIVFALMILLASCMAVGYLLGKNNKSDDKLVVVTEQKDTEKAEQKSTESTDPTSGWKTYTSPLSGYTVKYPSDWVVDNEGDSVFTNNLGGTSSSFSLISTERTGSYSGEDANTYMCVSFNDYSKSGWHNEPSNVSDRTSLGRFNLNDQVEAVLYLDKSKPSMLSRLVLSDEPTGINVSLGEEFRLRAQANFNCFQGDYKAIENDTSDFSSRPEVEVARNILKSVRN